MHTRKLSDETKCEELTERRKAEKKYQQERVE